MTQAFEAVLRWSRAGLPISLPICFHWKLPYETTWKSSHLQSSFAINEAIQKFHRSSSIFISPFSGEISTVLYDKAVRATTRRVRVWRTIGLWNHFGFPPFPSVTVHIPSCKESSEGHYKSKMTDDEFWGKKVKGLRLPVPSNA